MRIAVPPVRLAAARALLLPVVVGHRLGALSASRGREIAARVAFQGGRTTDILERGRIYAATTLPREVRPEALERIEWHRSQGDHVVVVSASLDVYLAPWCHAHGLEYICTVLEQRAGRFTGRYVGGDCSGREGETSEGAIRSGPIRDGLRIRRQRRRSGDARVREREVLPLAADLELERSKLSRPSASCECSPGAVRAAGDAPHRDSRWPHHASPERKREITHA